MALAFCRGMSYTTYVCRVIDEWMDGSRRRARWWRDSTSGRCVGWRRRAVSVSRVVVVRLARVVRVARIMRIARIGARTRARDGEG